MNSPGLANRVRLLVAAAIGLAALTLGCVSSYGPRFPQDIATALANEPMSRIETTNVYLYYPTRRRDQALRFLERVEGCVAYWRNQARIRNALATEKLTLI